MQARVRAQLRAGAYDLPPSEDGAAAALSVSRLRRVRPLGRLGFLAVGGPQVKPYAQALSISRRRRMGPLRASISKRRSALPSNAAKD